MMGRYLTDSEIGKAKELPDLFYTLPFGIDMSGPIWEQIFAKIKGGEWSGKRDNRPNPDVTVGGIRYSLKTESIRAKLTRARTSAGDFLGYSEDLIVARPPVHELLEVDGASLKDLSATKNGEYVLRAYNDIARKNWDKIGIFLRLPPTEFLYWEIDPPIYSETGYQWVDSGKARGQSRNIRTAESPARFRWTSGGSQFYVRYDIPSDADIIRIDPSPIALDQLLLVLASARQEVVL